MKRYHRMLWTPVILALPLLVAGLPVLAQSDEAPAYGDDYQPGDFGRVRYQENGVTIQRAAVDPGAPPVAEIGVNAPIFPGDTILAGPDQRVEVQLASGSLVRIDRVSELTFLALPDPYAEFRDNTILQLVEGTIQITSFLGDDEEFRVDTPSCSIYLLGDGDFRIETTRQGRSRVISHRGVAEVVGDGGSVLLRAGMLSEAYAGSYPSTPEPFNTFMADNFDGWVDEREAVYRARDRYQGGSGDSAGVYQDLPREVRPYYSELSHYGEWGYAADYGYVWYPSGVAASWRPYYDGYWEYGPGGYFWVSYEPWGWAPYHYGRWAWISGRGWAWIPGRVFAGAWVAWSWGSVYLGWAPLSYWNYPVYVGSSYYYYYDPHCWTFISYTNIHHRHYPRYAVPVDHVGGSLARTAVVTRPPRVSPRRLAESPDWRARAVREVEANDHARIRPTYRERRPEQDLRDVDRAIARRAPARTPERAARPGPASGTSSPGRQDANVRTLQRRSRGAAPGQPGLTEAGDNDRTPTKTYPRRISGRDAGDARRREVENGSSQPAPRREPAAGSSAREGSGRSATPSRVQPKQSTDGQSAERVRDLYRRMSSPRTTRERAGSPDGQSGADRTPRKSGSSSQEARRSTPRKPSPSAAPRPSSPSGRKSSTSARPGGSSSKPRSSGSGARSGSGGSKSRSSARGAGSRSGSSSKSNSGSGGKKKD